MFLGVSGREIPLLKTIYCDLHAGPAVQEYAKPDGGCLRCLSVKTAFTLLDFLELLEGGARFALLRRADRLVLSADFLLLETDLLLLHADLLILQAPALRVVPGTTILILGALVAVLDALDGLLDALLFASVLGPTIAGQSENDNDACKEQNDESAMSSKHGTPEFHNVILSGTVSVIGILCINLNRSGEEAFPKITERSSREPSVG